jgi:acyl carrier protein
MTPTERAILEIAQGVLQRTGIQLTDDFFDIGATSLAFTRILLQINQKLRVKLTGQELTDVASASALAACADAQLRIHRTHGAA